MYLSAIGYVCDLKCLPHSALSPEDGAAGGRACNDGCAVVWSINCDVAVIVTDLQFAISEHNNFQSIGSESRETSAT